MNKLYFFFDFDGTLTPIASRPDKVKISPSMQRVLKVLRDKPGCEVAIVSGRSIPDLKKLLGVSGFTLAGNHGLEVKSRNINFIHPGALKARGVLKEISKRIKKEISPLKGIFFEDKQASLSVHYRLVPANRISKLNEKFNKLIRPYYLTGRIKLTSGKKVWEIRPPINWHKGSITKWLIEKEKTSSKDEITSFYFGDDTTDEDAFRALKDSGITVKVGSSPSCARYRLKDSKAVEQFLINFTF